MATKSWLKLAAAAGGTVLGGAAASWAGGALWKRRTAEAVERLHAAAETAPTTLSHERLEGLPAPVVRYFEFALEPARSLPWVATVEHHGLFRIGGIGASWYPFASVQHFSAGLPGFVWDARIRMAPILSIRVRDSYLEGMAEMRGKLASVLPVVDQQGQPGLASGALHRYLAEAVWFPVALLPRPDLQWEAVDATTARAVLTDSGITVRLEFRFGNEGQIIGAYAAERYRDVKGEQVLTPWSCRYERYERMNGMMVPREGEVEWILPEGKLSYWRGHVDRISLHSGEGSLSTTS